MKNTKHKPNRKNIPKPLPVSDDSTNPSFPNEKMIEMISLEQLATIWNVDGIMLSEEQLSQIRNWLYAIAGIILSNTCKLKKAI